MIMRFKAKKPGTKKEAAKRTNVIPNRSLGKSLKRTRNEPRCRPDGVKRCIRPKSFMV